MAMSLPAMQIPSTLTAIAFALITTVAPMSADEVDELLKKGDVYDVKLQASEALDIYKQAEKMRPNDAQILVRIARQYRHLMADSGSRDEKVRLLETALSYGDRAAALAPKDSDAQLSSAISYGKLLPFQGKKEQVQSSIFIRSAAERAIALNPRNDLAWHILGRWHRVATQVGSVKRALASMLYQKLPPSSNADAVNCLQKAIEINPGRLMHYIELGRTFAQMGRKDDARRFIEKGLAMPSREKEDAEAKRDGLAVLAEL